MPEPMSEPTFAHYLVIDFEATCCDHGSVPRHAMEIIEFGVVMTDADFHVVDEFQSFVKPVRHPVLTPFCTELTSIRQQDVDSAPAFPECVAAFKAWLYQYPDFAFCSWGDYDRTQLQQDCDFHRITNPVSAPHFNVKRLFSEHQRLKKTYGLAGAIEKAGLTFSGTHHRGIDDARNIARLLPYVFGSAAVGA